MKFTTTFISLIASQTIGIFASPADVKAAELAAREAECGALGVMDWDLSKVPAGFDTSKLRKCKEHPASLVSPNEEQEKRDNNLFKRGGCLKKSSSGTCGKSGYCWKTCGNNGGPPPNSHQWCWLAYDDGWGSWITCSKDSDCKNVGNCGNGDCDDCGCGCLHW